MFSQSEFDSVFSQPGSVSQPGDGVSQGAKRKAPEEARREYLRVYETVPAQLLNAYGMARFATMEQDKVWEEFNKPLKTGAKYMTELCSIEEERRGVGLNRFFQVLVEYLKYQKTPSMRQQNKFILKEEICEQLYKEIDAIYESAVYCLAEKKQYTKKGASSLRNAVSFDKAATKSEETLKGHAEKVYKWITLKQSRLRMLMGWQAAGGLPYVSGTHLFAVQCFINCGNANHNQNEKMVSLEAFQNAVMKRHCMEVEGHAYLKEDLSEDFK